MACIFARREELRKVLTQLVFQESIDKHLVDYNYNIEVKYNILITLYSSVLQVTSSTR